MSQVGIGVERQCCPGRVRDKIYGSGYPAVSEKFAGWKGMTSIAGCY